MCGLKRVGEACMLIITTLAIQHPPLPAAQFLDGRCP